MRSHPKDSDEERPRGLKPAAWWVDSDGPKMVRQAVDIWRRNGCLVG